MASNSTSVWSAWGDCSSLSLQNDSMHSCINLGTACLTLVSCSFSIVGCIGIFVMFACGQPRTLSRWILLFIAVSDLLTALGYVFGSTVYIGMFLNPENNTITAPSNCSDPSLFENDTMSRHTAGRHRLFCGLCQAQSFITTSSSMFSFFWTSVLAFHLFLSVAASRDRLSRRLMPVYHIVSWSVGLIITSVVCGFGNLGPGGSDDSVAWCFIDRNEDTIRASTTIALEFLAGKFWEILTYILTGVFYTMLVVAVYKQKTNEYSPPRLGLEWKLILVPILFVLIRIWGTIRFFLAFSEGDTLRKSKFLLNMQAAGDGAQGWVNGIIFVLLHTKAIAVYKICCCCCCCGDKRQGRRRGLRWWAGSRNQDDYMHFGGGGGGVGGSGSSTRHLEVNDRLDESHRIVVPSFGSSGSAQYGSLAVSNVDGLLPQLQRSFKSRGKKKMITSSDALSTPIQSDSENLR